MAPGFRCANCWVCGLDKLEIMKPIKFSILVWMLMFSVASYCSPSNSSFIKENLQAFLDGKIPANELEITYTDLHGLWGGLQITIHGSGKVEQKAVRTQASSSHDITQEEMNQLVKLLIELEAWIQKVPERPPIPDESRAYLRIRIGEANSEIWEWYNDMKENNHLIRILDKIKEITWEETE